MASFCPGSRSAGRGAALGWPLRLGSAPKDVFAPEDAARAELVLAPRAEAGEVWPEVDQARRLHGLRTVL
eukprot:1476081-Alexandrium_andersonii.AAC.1